MNFDPNSMDPDSIKNMINSFSQMSDTELSELMKSMGLNMDPKILRTFADKMKNASDDDLKNLKDQYKKGSINMNSFSKSQQQATPPEIAKLKLLLSEAKSLFNDNKHAESAEMCYETLKTYEETSAEFKEEQKEFWNEFLPQVREQLTLAKFKQEDYDIAISECLTALEEKPSFSIYNRLGIIYFKKGKHVKARDNFLKAKEMFPNDVDKIADNYLKQALEEIENY